MRAVSLLLRRREQVTLVVNRGALLPAIIIVEEERLLIHRLPLTMQAVSLLLWRREHVTLVANRGALLPRVPLIMRAVSFLLELRPWRREQGPATIVVLTRAPLPLIMRPVSLLQGLLLGLLLS